jgi:undecaprenyl-phosphate 4-deoxy-4-formamido-L-arabinose transferase
VPVYNSEATLQELVARLMRVLPTIAGDFEIILVNDGSRDSSWKRVSEGAKQFPQVRGIDLMRNYGQHNALLAGIRASRYETIVTLDDDLQNPPEEIPRIVAKLEEGFDVVYGTPGKTRQPFWKHTASMLTKVAMQSAMSVEIARQVSAFRAFRSEVRVSFDEYLGSFLSVDVLLSWGAKRFGAVEVQHDQRKAGESQYTFWKLVTHAVNMLTGFSTLPLQVASMVGFAFTVFGFLVLAYVVGRYFALGYSVAGFPFLASIIAIFSGAQLFALGVMGEYLARMHFRLMGRPPYAVRRQIGARREAEIDESTCHSS